MRFFKRIMAAIVPLSVALIVAWWAASVFLRVPPPPLPPAVSVARAHVDYSRTWILYNDMNCAEARDSTNEVEVVFSGPERYFVYQDQTRAAIGAWDQYSNVTAEDGQLEVDAACVPRAAVLEYIDDNLHGAAEVWNMASIPLSRSGWGAVVTEAVDFIQAAVGVVGNMIHDDTEGAAAMRVRYAEILLAPACAMAESEVAATLNLARRPVSSPGNALPQQTPEEQAYYMREYRRLKQGLADCRQEHRQYVQDYIESRSYW